MQLVLLPLQTSCSCPGLIPQCCREHAEAEGLGSMRRTKEGLACDTKCRFGELDTSHRVVTVCVCVLILGRKQDKKANPLHQSSRPLPHYVFLDVVFSSLSELPCWYELESSQSSFRCSDLQQSQSSQLGFWWTCWGSAKVGSALSSARLLCTLGFFTGKRRQRYSLMAMDLSMPLNGVSHFCACSFCPCRLGKDSGSFELWEWLSQGHTKAGVQGFTCSQGMLLEQVSGAGVESGGIKKHMLLQQRLRAGTFFKLFPPYLYKANGFQIFLLDDKHHFSNPTYLFSCAFLLAAAEDISNVSTTEYEPTCLSKSS